MALRFVYPINYEIAIPDLPTSGRLDREYPTGYPPLELNPSLIVTISKTQLFSQQSTSLLLPQGDV